MFSLLPIKLARASQTLLHKLREMKDVITRLLLYCGKALGLALALKIYLNSPHAVSHSEKELFSTAVELLCLFICLFALNMSVSQLKKKTIEQKIEPFLQAVVTWLRAQTQDMNMPISFPSLNASMDIEIIPANVFRSSNQEFQN